MQRTDLEVKTSEIEARTIFFRLIDEMVPWVHQSLFGPWKLEALPAEAVYDRGRISDRWMRLALIHTKDPSSYKLNLTALGCGSTVRDTPFMAYFEFLHKSAASIKKITTQVEEELIPINGTYAYNEIRMKFILERLIPDWNSLKSNAKARRLCSSLESWASQFNLRDDWIYDAALDGFALIKTGLVDKVSLPDHYLESTDSCRELRQYTLKGTAWNFVPMHWRISRFFETTRPETGIPVQIQETDLIFKFHWNTPGDHSNGGFDLEAYFNPYFQSKESFKRSVETAFWSKFLEFYSDKWSSCAGRTGDIGIRIKRFENKVEDFTNRVSNKVAVVSKNVPKIKNDSHFRWLIDHQINKLGWADLEAKYERDKKTIRDGVKRAADLTGLTLRKGTIGRPLGASTKLSGAGRVK